MNILDTRDKEELLELISSSSGGGGTVGEVNICSEVSGKNPTIQDSTDAPIISQTVKGFTKQDGTPTPDAPVEIVGMDNVSVKTCGKNVFGATLEDFQNGEVSGEARKVIFNLKPNTTYVCSTNAPLNGTQPPIWFNGTVGSTHGVSAGTSRNTITDENGQLFLCIRNTMLTQFFDGTYWIQVEEGDTATTYEPYKQTVAEFDLTDPLYEGDYIEYRADGTGVLHRKMAKVVLTSNSINVQTSTSYNYFAVTPSKKKQTDDNLSACNKSKLINPKEQSKDIGTYYENPANFVFIVSKDETSDAIKQKYNGTMLLYELAEPTETPLTAEQVAQFKKLCTFEPVTNILCDGEVEIQYYKNTPSGVAVGTVHRMADKTIELTKAEYEALPDSKLSDDITYFIIDDNSGTGGGSGDGSAIYDGDGNVITETYVKKKPKMIVLTDSYGVVNGNNSWCYKFASFLGLTLNQDIFIKAVESTGFTSPCPYTFLGNLNQMTIANPDEITDIVVCGGLNDIHYNTIDTILSVSTAIETFVTTCKTKFPNAQVHIGFIGNALSTTYIENKINKMLHPITVAINLYKNCARYGARYLNGVEYLLRNVCMFNSDMVHPNNDGALWIANGVANAFMTGNACATGSNTLGLTVSDDLKTTGLVACSINTFIDNSTCGIILDVQAGQQGQISCYPNTRNLPTTKGSIYDFELGTLTNSYISGVLNEGIKGSLYCKVSLYNSSGVNSQVLLPCEMRVKNNKLYISFAVPDAYVSGKINGFVVEPCQIICNTLNN